jgi:hypothetical protein
MANKGVSSEDVFEVARKVYQNNPFAYIVTFKKRDDGITEVGGGKEKYCQIINPRVELREVEGVRAIFAKEKIEKGKSILMETPFLRFFNDNLNQRNSTLMYADWMSRNGVAVSFLSDKMNDIFPREHNQVTREMAKWLVEKYKDDKSMEYLEKCSNDIALLFSKIVRNSFMHQRQCCIFSYASNFNHSCEPNAEWEIGEWKGNSSLQLVIRASIDIEPGKEITISYIPNSALSILSKQERLAYIEKNHSFVCKCSRCI